MGEEEYDFKEEEEEKEGSEEGFPCPHCGKPHEAYLLIGKIRSPRCPTCHRLIKPGLIPEKYIMHVDKKEVRERKEKYPELYERKEENISGIKSIFPEVREPWMILRDVLQYHGLKEDFIGYAVRKCKSKEVLHPMELRHMLEDLDSGIKTKRQVEYIVNDYIESLYAEREKAESRGEVYPFIGFESPTGRSSGMVPSFLPPSRREEPRAMPQTVYGGYTERMPYGRYGYEQQYHAEHGRSDDVKELMSKFIQEIRQILVDREREREIDEVKKTQVEMMEQFRNMMIEMYNRQQEQLERILEGMKARDRGDEMSVLFTLLKDMQKDQREAFERMLDRIDRAQSTKSLDPTQLLKEFKADIEKMLMEKRFEEISRKIEETKKQEKDEKIEEIMGKITELKLMIDELRTPTGEYKDDTFRFLAESVDRLSRAVEKKEPIKEVARVVAELAGVAEKKEMPEEMKVKVKETVSEVADLLKQIGAEEYVEE